MERDARVKVASFHAHFGSFNGLFNSELTFALYVNDTNKLIRWGEGKGDSFRKKQIRFSECIIVSNHSKICIKRGN